MLLKAFTKLPQPFVKAQLGILFECVYLVPHLVVFLTQLLDQLSSATELNGNKREDVIFFCLEVPSQTFSEELKHPIDLQSAIGGPGRARGLGTTENQTLSDDQPIVVVMRERDEAPVPLHVR